MQTSVSSIGRLFYGLFWTYPEFNLFELYVDTNWNWICKEFEMRYHLYAQMCLGFDEYQVICQKASYLHRCYELKWSGGWRTGTVGWLSASERVQYLEGCPAMNTKCWVPLPFLPDLIFNILRTVLRAHQCWYHPKHSNQARIEQTWAGCASSTCGGCRSLR